MSAAKSNNPQTFEGRHYWPSADFSVPADGLCLNMAPSPNTDCWCIRPAGHPGAHRYEMSPTIRESLVEGRQRMSGFRSWAEDYVRPDDPINYDAFLYRRRQRGMRDAAARSTRTAKTLVDGSHLFFSQREIRETREARERETNPVLRAQLHLQRRGFVVVRADVLRFKAEGWSVSGQAEPIDDDALIALARRHGLPAKSTNMNGEEQGR